jgi:rubrerythrin
MLTRSIVLAVQEGQPDVARLYAPKRITAAYITVYLQTDDETLVRWVLGEPGKPSGQLMGRLRRRELVKQVFSAPLARCGDAVFRQRIATPAGQQELEHRIANICSNEKPWLVFVHFQEGKPLRKGAGQEGPETIHVLCSGGEWQNYDTVSPVFRFGAHRQQDYLHVYAPIKGTSQPARERTRTELEDKIAELIGLSGPRKEPSVCPQCGHDLPARKGTQCPVCGQVPDGMLTKEQDDA